MNENGRFTGKVAFVTGVGSGIGRATALAFEREGASVVVASRSEEQDRQTAVDHWSEHWNDDPKPFVWHCTAEEIIAKVRRGRAALDRVTKSAMHH